MHEARERRKHLKQNNESDHPHKKFVSLKGSSLRIKPTMYLLHFPFVFLSCATNTCVKVGYAKPQVKENCLFSVYFY